MKNKLDLNEQELVNYIYTRFKQGYDKNEIFKEIQEKWKSDKNEK